MTERSEISVIIPTYNRARLLGRAIESVINQSMRPAQVIVVDGDSTDDTADVCKAYAEWVLYEWQRNAGVSAARNTGIRLARYPWVAFLDSDDYWTPSHLERMTAAIHETGGEASFYFSDMQMPEADGGGTHWQMAGFRPRTPLHLIRDASAWVLMKWQPTMLQSSVINRLALEKVGGMDQSKPVGEDTYLFCQLGIGGVACAVSGVGCVQTSDDISLIRLTVDVPPGSEKNLAVACKLWREVLGWQDRLPPCFRRLVTYNVAGSHLGLAKLLWRSGRPISAIWRLLLVAKSDPRLAAWLIRNRSSKGYDEAMWPTYAECSAERLKEY
jgi:glycosyltransferase involved in cell wall biosynthesis